MGHWVGAWGCQHRVWGHGRARMRGLARAADKCTAGPLRFGAVRRECKELQYGSRFQSVCLITRSVCAAAYYPPIQGQSTISTLPQPQARCHVPALRQSGSPPAQFCTRKRHSSAPRLVNPASISAPTSAAATHILDGSLHSVLYQRWQRTTNTPGPVGQGQHP